LRRLAFGDVKRSLLRYAWALPATIMALPLVVVAVSAGAAIHFVDGVIEVGGGRAGRAVARLPAALRFSAMTLGHVILGIDQQSLRSARRHEQVHVRQYERFGVLFFVLYAGSSVAQLLRGRRPYFDNCFEREAYSCGAAHDDP
jgi:hypothetical protein